MNPSTPAEFIGKTHTIAKALFFKVPQLKANPKLDVKERRWIFCGDPGTGKSSLAYALAAALSGDSLRSIYDKTAFSVQQVNGQSWTVDMVRQWTLDGHYRPMGDLRVQIVDEIDAVGGAALNEARSYLDHLPTRTIFFGTTNKEPEELQEQLQSRAKVQHFEKIPDHQMAAHLAAHYPALSAKQIAACVKSAKGNVRAAETDALNIIDMIESLAA